MTTLNKSRQENTGVVGGIGDWIGEKTGAYSTGKEIYENQMKQIQERAKALHAQLLAEFNRKTLSPTEQANIDILVLKLEKMTGVKLEHISWADAVLTSTHITNAPMRYAIRTTAGAAEGAYEGVTGIMEITGKAIGILTAYALEPQARDIIKNDISEIFSQLTLENAKKLLAALPKAFEEFQKLPGDKQIEGAMKFIGMMLVPLGIGAKGIKAGKAVVETGLAATKAGGETAIRAARIMAKQAKRASGASKNALKVAGKASIAGATALTLGTGATTVGATAIAGGTAVRYVGEMGGGKQKISTEVAEKVAIAEKIESPRRLVQRICNEIGYTNFKE